LTPGGPQAQRSLAALLQAERDRPSAHRARASGWGGSWQLELSPILSAAQVPAGWLQQASLGLEPGGCFVPSPALLPAQLSPRTRIVLANAAADFSLPGALAGLDPGRSKCGLVLCDPGQQRLVAAALLSPEQTLEQLQLWREGCGLRLVVIGDGTGSRDWQQRLRGVLPVCTVDERGTTLAARQRFWQLFPPQGWRLLLPPGLRQPPRDWDDVVAQLLLERWLERPLGRDAQLPLQRQPHRLAETRQGSAELKSAPGP
jgi:RNase H-fold protein (predicted Holliday junction resolvase)